MMQSTRPLKSFRAATSYTRPATTTIDDNPEAECACEEMKRGINVLLVADSNPGDKPPLVKIPVIGGLVEPNVGPPIPLWDRIFAYTVANAFDSLKSQRIRVVYDHEDPAGRAKVLPGALRFDDQVRDNHRLRRQGAFDNVHFAPPMQLTRKITRIAIMKGFVPVAEAHLADVDMERWHFNDITMAPICAHDCFHLHWRWGEEPVNPDDLTAFGWGGGGVCGKPYTERGNPLIPKNQELFIRLTSKRSMIYEATARRVEARTWQVIGHHGAAYITDTGFMVDLGRRTQDLFAVAGLVPTVYAELDEIAKGAEGELSALVNWALFYWRNRFTIRSDGTGPIERTEINDLQAILTGKPRPGRH
jgi:hypothetical protein